MSKNNIKTTAQSKKLKTPLNKLFLFIIITVSSFSILQLIQTVGTTFYQATLLLSTLSILIFSLTSYYNKKKKIIENNYVEKLNYQINSNKSLQHTIKNLEKSLQHISKKVTQTEKIVSQKNQIPLNETFSSDVSIISSTDTPEAYIFGKDVTDSSSIKTQNKLINHVISHLKKNGQNIKVLKPNQEKYTNNITSTQPSQERKIKGNIFEFPPNLINYN